MQTRGAAEWRKEWNVGDLWKANVERLEGKRKMYASPRRVDNNKFVESSPLTLTQVFSILIPIYLRHNYNG